MNRATLLVLLGGLALTAAFVVVPGAAASGPFVPESDAEALEEVPKSAPRPTAAPVLEWLRQTKFAEARLLSLAKELGTP